MTQDSAVEDIVHRHAKAIVTMDIGQIMNDLMPDAMMKLQQEAGGGRHGADHGRSRQGHWPRRNRGSGRKYSLGVGWRRAPMLQAVV